jgi:hypothetical protein
LPFLLTTFLIVTDVSASLRPGEKRSYVPEKRHVTTMGAESLNFILNYGDLPLVSPDYPQRATIETSPSDETPCTQKESLSVTNEVLTMAMCTRFPREHRVLAPRPGKKTISVAVLHRVSIHLTISSAVKAGTRSSGAPPPMPLIPNRSKSVGFSGGLRLNKFVRRLHDMLQAENDSGLVEWRKGLLVLYSTDAFAKKLLPKYFKTQNFKTFRRQVRMVVLMDKLCLES